MKPHWTEGNCIKLLENGEEFFPAVFEAIEGAEREVVLETFIWFDDKVGRQLRDVLLAAARRGVKVDVTVDAWGCRELSPAFISVLTEAGIVFRAFDPEPRLFGRNIEWIRRANMLRRMHRKIVVVDARVAFVGGINYSADHLDDFGPEAKQDYAARIEGPVVDDIHRFVHAQFDARAKQRWRVWRKRRKRAPSAAPVHERAGDAKALFVVRDNLEHRTDIEKQYRIAIRAAKREVVIANAYFFPGYRLLKEMRRAARRGVRVVLILQGQPDMPIVKFGASLLYEHLLDAGVEIQEYCKRPLHGKVALADDEWATVGSSNLDPLSLSLNLEANIVVLDREFNRQLRESIDELQCEHCRRVERGHVGRHAWWHTIVTTVAFHVLRHFPTWAAWLPEHREQFQHVGPPRSSTPAATRIGAGESG